MLTAAPAGLLLASAINVGVPDVRFVDATADVGLPEINATHLCLADLNGDVKPDLIIRAIEAGKPDRYRVYLAAANGDKPRFVELEKPTGLPKPRAGDCLVFADLDNDGHADAIFSRYLDINNKDFKDPEAPERTCWLKGRGDGTFEAPRIIDAAKRATTTCIAVGDVDRDGKLDLYLGNWYTKYGESNEAFTNDLLIADGDTTSWRRQPLGEDAWPFTEEDDAAGRPNYGVMIVNLHTNRLSLLDLSYGRRANRLWPYTETCGRSIPPAGAEAEIQKAQALNFIDEAPALGLDGDSIRHGKYPDWLKERAKTDKRFDREDEKPYRSHGNYFDAAIGDIDNDGDFDLFFAAITHAWAGESSDRSRFLVNQAAEKGGLHFESPARLCVDRIPPIPPREDWTKPPLGSEEKPWYPRWNQGDLFCELADLDNDGRLDLILCSSDYPDPAPFDQRLRIFHQEEDGTFKDITPACGIDHVGAQQLSLGDVDGDGRLDIIVGQSYNRMDKDLVDKTNARQGSQGPRMRVYLNRSTSAGGDSPVGGALTLHLTGNPAKGCSRDALGAIVRVTTAIRGKTVTQLRQLVGIGGCTGKQHEFVVHIGLGDAAAADRVEITWPDSKGTSTVLEHVAAGRHELSMP